MKTIALRIPEDILLAIPIPKERWQDELKKELALQLYRDKLLSFANAQRLAGLTKIEFHYLLGDHAIPRQYDIADYEKDIRNLEMWDAEA